jgi:hypothetical protein
MSYDGFRKMFPVRKETGEIVGVEIFHGPNRPGWTALVQGHPVWHGDRPSEVQSFLDGFGSHNIDFRTELVAFNYPPLKPFGRKLPEYE